MTIGIRLFSKSDFKNWPEFLKKIKRLSNSEPKSPSKRIWELLTTKTQRLIIGWNEDEEPDSDIKSKIIDELNDILSGKNFYDKAYFKDVELPDEIKKSVSSSEDDTIKKNRRLIEESFSETINKYEKYYEKLIDQQCIQILERSTYYSDIIQIGNKKDGELFTNIIFHTSNLIKKEHCEKDESKYLCDIICEKSITLVKFIKQKNTIDNNIVLLPISPSGSIAKLLGDSYVHEKIVGKIIEISDRIDVRSKKKPTDINTQDKVVIFTSNYRPEFANKYRNMKDNLIGIILILGLARSIKEKLDLPENISNKIHEVISIDEISNDKYLRNKIVKKKGMYE